MSYELSEEQKERKRIRERERRKELKEVDRMAKEWIAAGKTGHPPNKIRKRVTELRPNAHKRKLAVTKYRQELREVQKKLQLETFIEEFLQNGGNATEAAKKVSNVTSRQAANSLGSRLTKEARGLTKMYLEKRGFSLGKFLDIAIEKTKESNKPDWWDRLMRIAGYDNPLLDKKGPAPVVNIYNSQKQDVDEFGFGEAVEGEEASEEENGDQV